MSDSALYQLATIDRTSGGGHVVSGNLRTLAMLHPDVLTLEGDARFDLVPRNWAGPRELLTGRFVLIPQNAWPWHGARPTFEAKSYCTRLRLASEISMRRALGVIRLGDAIPPIGNATEQVYSNVLDEGFDLAAPNQMGNRMADSGFVSTGSPTPYRGLETLAGAYRRYRARGGRRPLAVTAGRLAGLFDGLDGVRLLAEGLTRAQVLALLADSSAAVLTSTVETSPIGALEASTLSPAVIASDIPGHRELLHSDARFFPVSDVSELTELLCSIDDGVCAGAGRQISDSPAARDERRRRWCNDLARELRRFASQSDD